MSIITFSDGQTVQSTIINRVTLFRHEQNLLVETTGDSLKVHGAGVHADASSLDDVRDRERLHFNVYQTVLKTPSR
jgi:hypothetical protein